MTRRGTRPKSAWPKSLRNHRTPEVKSWGIQWCMPCFWCLMRYLIRLAKSRFDDWVNGQGAEKPQWLTDSIFRPTKAHRKEFKGLLEDSTYLVEGPIEEAALVQELRVWFQACWDRAVTVPLASVKGKIATCPSPQPSTNLGSLIRKRHNA